MKKDDEVKVINPDSKFYGYIGKIVEYRAYFGKYAVKIKDSPIKMWDTFSFKPDELEKV